MNMARQACAVSSDTAWNGWPGRSALRHRDAGSARPEDLRDDRFFRHLVLQPAHRRPGDHPRRPHRGDERRWPTASSALPGREDTSAARSSRCCMTSPKSCASSSGLRRQRLPNRAEMRLARRAASIGYTLSLVRDDDGRRSVPTLFFKDLTRVEQIEERERLRDRLAALGEMAAAIAHEVKNPLAGIEVMAGSCAASSAIAKTRSRMLADIINEAKMANAIVVEVLEFVRPIRLQVERRALDEVMQDSITLAEGKMRRGSVSIDTDDRTGCAGVARRPASAAPAVHEPADQRVRSARRRGSRATSAYGCCRARKSRSAPPIRSRRRWWSRCATIGPGIAAD